MSLETDDLKKLLDQFDESQRKDIVAAMGSKANLPIGCTDSSMIAHRFRELGGNAIRNKARGGGPLYSEIVNDVAKITGVPTDGKTHEVEERIYDLMSVASLPRSDVNKAKQVVCESANKAKEEFAGFWNKAKQGKAEIGGAQVAAAAGFLVSRAVSAPLSAGLLAKAATDPDYDAVVPALVMIAGYRMVARSVSDLPIEPTRTAETQTYHVVHRDENGLAIEACVVNKSEAVHWMKLDNDAKEDISTLSPLLSNLPGIATAADVHTTNYMIVKVNGDLTPSKTGNGGARAWTTGDNGRIESHAELFDSSRLKKLVNTGVLFNIASTAVAQAHLADINKKLDEIKTQLNDLKNWLKDQRKATIESASKEYSIWSKMGSKFNAKDNLNSINRIDFRLSEVADSISDDIRNELSRLEALDAAKEWLGTGDYHNDVEIYCGSIKALIDQWYFVMRLRVFGLQFLAIIPSQYELAMEKYKALHKEIINKSYGSVFISDIDSVIREKASGVKSSFNFASTLGQRKASVLGHCKNIVDSSEDILNRLPDFDALSNAYNPQETLLHVEYRNGEIVRIGAETSGLGI